MTALAADNLALASNLFAGAGYVVQDAQFFTTRTGRPKVTLRVAFPRHPRLPRKPPDNNDYYTIVAYGDRFTPLVDHLRVGAPVVVFGYLQSRDVEVAGAPRTVSEVGAHAIYLIKPLEGERDEDLRG